MLNALASWPSCGATWQQVGIGCSSGINPTLGPSVPTTHPRPLCSFGLPSKLLLTQYDFHFWPGHLQCWAPLSSWEPGGAGVLCDPS